MSGNFHGLRSKLAHPPPHAHTVPMSDRHYQQPVQLIRIEGLSEAISDLAEAIRGDGLHKSLLAAVVALQGDFQRLEQEWHNMSGTIGDAIAQLQADVAQLTSVDQAAIALITGLSSQLAAALAAAANAGATPEQLQALTDLHSAIVAQDTALAGAVSANTPAAGP